ncbi:MAG: LysR substrate-binding domain-containing protein [Nevskia sp.]|jgi:LysR family transcriptional regulator, low CO2-responsive transcriptional regulator|nr:LysR substrate-binding domain-containing protein [Nevskia sp.]MCK9384533.1 LysR substrate-binding domain-containing protein [Nevskia sp.]
MLNLSLRQLRSFVAAARHLSFARAAEELHLTAPAVSMQIRELETALGLPVFERTGRAVSLTTTGEYLLVYARRVLNTLKEAEDTIARLRGLQAGRISIGMVGTAQYFLPRLLALFRLEHPGVDVRLTVGNRDQLGRQLHDREIDLAIMGRPPRELDTRAEPFAANLLGVIAAHGHPLVGERSIAPGRLDREVFIVRETGSGTRAAMEAFFREQRITPPAVMQMSSNETIKQAVIANMGLTLLSLHTLGLELQVGQLAVLDVVGLPLKRAWHVVNLSSMTLSPATEAFRYFILERGEQLLTDLFAPTIKEAVRR